MNAKDEQRAREADGDRADDREWAKGLHDRASEVELIISGAVVFGLFQVPGHVDGWFDALQLRLGPSYYFTVFVVWYYTKLIVYTLIGSFSLHILARSYWIGLLGLDVAFPEGIRWENIRYGPVAKDAYRRSVPSVVSMARAADRFGSTVFATGFWIVFLFVMSVTMAGAAGAVALAVKQWVLPGVPLVRVWATLMALIALVPVSFVGADRLLGDRVDPEGVLARMIRGGVRAGYFTFAGPLLLPIQFTLFSNLRRRLVYPGVVTIFVLLIGIFIAGERMRRGDWFISSSEAFPTRTGALVSNARFYENQDPDLAEGVPTIPSDIIRGRYVRLRVPFVARRDAPRLRVACPDLPEASRQGLVATSDRDEPPSVEAEATLLACTAGLWEVRLDGDVVDPDWSFSAVGGNGISGIVAYLATDELGSGAHVLEVAEAAPPRDPGDEAEGRVDGESGLRRYFIRFWI